MPWISAHRNWRNKGTICYTLNFHIWVEISSYLGGDHFSFFSATLDPGWHPSYKVMVIITIIPCLLDVVVPLNQAQRNRMDVILEIRTSGVCVQAVELDPCTMQKQLCDCYGLAWWNCDFDPLRVSQLTANVFTTTLLVILSSCMIRIWVWTLNVVSVQCLVNIVKVY